MSGMKSAVPFLFTLLMLAACGKKQDETKAADTNFTETSAVPTDSLTEDEVIDMVFALPEVKERADYIEKETKGQRHMQALINQSPDATTTYYWVKAGEDNGTNFVTHFHFYVYPDRRILYYDAANDTTLDLPTWRARRNEDKNNN